MKALKNTSALRFFAAGLFCLAAAYLTEPTLGAIATLPFIIVLPAIGYILYRNILHIGALCALGGFIFKYFFVSELKTAVFFAVLCAFYGIIGAVFAKLLINARKNKKLYIASAAVLICSFLIFSVFHGTFFANLSSKALNEEYLKNTYPEETFSLGSTYYSFSDKCYLTEFVFNDSEVYLAKIGVKNGKNKIVKVNGYRDYCEARLLEAGTKILTSYFSNYVHEGEDFALRRDRIEETKLLTTDSVPEDFYGDMCYEIAFYALFAEKSDFEEMCRQYISYIPESFAYHSIRFYGLGESGEFEFAFTYEDEALDFVSESFDEKSFEHYFSDSDTHKYWEFIK